ncbi:NnrS family protein [Craterilacuibacter sp. RT1T]|uniref:NnrS family protein n=1 Tax=Craterilacuibacter sp. RT1T TaxID=2942211 RepID=UPI0020BFF93F|nr:NnrS family protein [Craterilacuibacter sp. RT1T]MCL6264718.1 NnrS family protein [Craterilacuibacter sp. RT1T]
MRPRRASVLAATPVVSVKTDGVVASFRWLAMAPHRAGFFLGGSVLLLAMFWWLLELAGRTRGISLSSLPASFLHGQLMLAGFFPLFMLGFIYTAGPKWLGVASPATGAWLAAIGMYALGSAGLVLTVRLPVLWPLASTLQALAWSGACLIWAGRIRASTIPERQHAIVILAAFTFGAIGFWLYAFAAAYAQWQFIARAETLLLWGMLLPVFLTVCHRMLPFFSAHVLPSYLAWRPRWLLYALVGGVWLHGFLALLRVDTFPLDMGLAVLLLYTSWRWKWHQSLQVPLLAMLHIAFLWAGLGMMLLALAIAPFSTPLAGSDYAALHALALGFMLSMLLAFVTRVTLGHSGRALIAGRMTWTLFWLLQVITILRLLGEWLPELRTPLLLTTVAGIVLTFALWSARYLPMYLQPRADGQTG